MKQQIFPIIAGLILLIVLTSGCTTDEETDMIGSVPINPEGWIFRTEEYPPFNYMEDGVAKGSAVDLLKGAFQQMGAPISEDQIQFQLWAYAYNATLSEKKSVIFSTVRHPERENLFKWAGPIGSEQKVIFAEQGRDLEISGPDDLLRYRIGVVKDDAAVTELLKLGFQESDIYATGDVEQLISLIEEDIIDIWCYGDHAGRYITERVTGDADYFTTIYTLETHDLYYAFNRETPDSVVDAFQSALDTLRQTPDPDGTSG